MTGQLSISPGHAVAVIVTSIVMYVVFVGLIRLTGPRTLVSTSNLDYACVASFGAIIGRTSLLDEPTLATGLIALVTLVATQRLVTRLRNSAPARWARTQPVVLVRDGQLIHHSIDKARITHNDLRQLARSKGATSLSDLRLVVLERNGSISMSLGSAEPDAWLTGDIVETQP